MNLFGDLVAVYDANVGSAGIVGERNAVLFPLYHVGQNTQITVTIDMEGNFLRASVNAEEDEFTVIPATLDSSCRSSNTAPHPCGDRIDYLCGNMKKYYPEIASDISKQSKNENRYATYMAQLANWSESPYATPKIQAIYDYESKNCLVDDLVKSGILVDKGEGLNSKMKVNKTSIDTCAIRFAVEANDADEEYIAETWLDPQMYQSWIEYYRDLVDRTFPKDYCYVTGEYVPITTKHSNGIRANSDFAKLISSNENGMIVYSADRFKGAEQAVTIGYEASLKIHNALRWLVSLQGKRNEENIVVAWNDNGSPVYIPYDADTPHTYQYADAPDEEKVFESKADYYANLEEKAKALSEQSGNIHFLELDSSFKGALKGRLSVLNYQVYPVHEYFKNVFNWHEKYFWNMKGFTGCPSVYDFVLAAYGIGGSDWLKIPSQRLYTMYRNRIVQSIVMGKEMPENVIRKLMEHASMPTKYPKSKAYIWSIACAAINGKEGMDLMLDKNCTDRDYLFGRLLAMANHVERLTFVEGDAGRETNAIRYMADFVNKPATNWNHINRKIQPYLKKLNRRKPFLGEHFRREMDNILVEFTMDGFSDEPLGNKYLLGFSAQSAAMWKKKTQDEDVKENE